MPVFLRRVTRADSETVEALWQRATEQRRLDLGIGPLDHQAAVFERDGVFGVGLFEGDSLISVAVAMPAKEDNGRSVHNVPGLTHISSIATLPGRWGEGHGGRVVEAVLSHARRRGYSRAQLWTHATNLRALQLYQRLGFALSGRVGIDPHDEAIVHLLRDVPVSPPVFRPAARMICRDSDDRILLMHWRDPLDGHQVWEPPGGGIEDGEEPLAAVLREWDEETGLAPPTITAPPTTVGRDTFWGGGRIVTDEWFFLGRLNASSRLEPAALTAVEQESLLGWDWLALDEIASLDDPAEPDLAPILERLSTTPDG